MGLMDDLRQAVIYGNATGAQEFAKQALSEGIPPENILNAGFVAAMSEVGRRFESGDFFVPEMLIAARAMKTGLELLRPRLTAANVKAVGKVVIGTVEGDLHDVGKNLVAMMLEGAGFEVIDLGADVSPQKFAEAVRVHNPDLVGCSALLTTTMPKIRETLEALKESGLRESVKVMIGGAPVTEKHCADIGADIYAPDASSAASKARQAMHSEL